MPVSILYCRVAVSSLGAGSIRVNSNRDSPGQKPDLFRCKSWLGFQSRQTRNSVTRYDAASYILT